MKLYNYAHGGTSHRLRIALRLKGLAADYIAVNLRTEEHLGAGFKRQNLQGLLPAMEHDGAILTQTPAIIECMRRTRSIPAGCPRVASGRRPSPIKPPTAAPPQARLECHRCPAAPRGGPAPRHPAGNGTAP